MFIFAFKNGNGKRGPTWPRSPSETDSFCCVFSDGLESNLRSSIVVNGQLCDQRRRAHELEMKLEDLFPFWAGEMLCKRRMC